MDVFNTDYLVLYFMSISTLPLPVAASLLAAIVALRVILITHKERVSAYFMGAFFGLLALQTIFIAYKYNYFYEVLGFIQPITAMLVCPSAYLAFQSLKESERATLNKRWRRHSILPILALLFIGFGLDQYMPIDLVIFASFITYIYLFFCEVVLGSERFESFGTEVASKLQSAQLAVLTLIVLILLFDSLLFFNFQYLSGLYTQTIVISGSILLIISSSLLLMTPWDLTNLSGFISLDNNQDTAISRVEREDYLTFERLNTLMIERRLYLDPSINITRVSKLLVLPTRRVSNAVNRVGRKNFSQYINQLRVKEACSLLENNELSVTDIMFQAGFQTKSSFNREFLNYTKQSPSAYRKSKLL